MKLIKSALFMAALVAASGAAQAAPVSFSGSVVSQTRTPDGDAGPVGDTLAGSGTVNGGITNFLGLSSVFVDFSGYVSKSFMTVSSIVVERFSGGMVSIYKDISKSDLLLTLQPRALDMSGNTLEVVVTSGSAKGDQFLDVTGGSLAFRFDPSMTTYDLQVTTTFQLANCVPSLPTGAGTQTCSNGGFQANGTSLDVPEPGSLALAGLGLLGLASIRRRKSQR